MKRTIALILTLSLLLFTFTACNDQGNKDKEDSIGVSVTDVFADIEKLSASKGVEFEMDIKLDISGDMEEDSEDILDEELFPILENSMEFTIKGKMKGSEGLVKLQMGFSGIKLTVAEFAFADGEIFVDMEKIVSTLFGTVSSVLPDDSGIKWEYEEKYVSLDDLMTAIEKNASLYEMINDSLGDLDISLPEGILPDFSGGDKEEEGEEPDDELDFMDKLFSEEGLLAISGSRLLEMIPKDIMEKFVDIIDSAMKNAQAYALNEEGYHTFTVNNENITLALVSLIEDLKEYIPVAKENINKILNESDEFSDKEKELLSQKMSAICDSILDELNDIKDSDLSSDGDISNEFYLAFRTLEDKVEMDLDISSRSDSGSSGLNVDLTVAETDKSTTFTIKAVTAEQINKFVREAIAAMFLLPSPDLN